MIHRVTLRLENGWSGVYDLDTAEGPLGGPWPVHYTYQGFVMEPPEEVRQELGQTAWELVYQYREGRDDADEDS